MTIINKILTDSDRKLTGVCAFGRGGIICPGCNPDFSITSISDLGGNITPNPEIIVDHIVQCL